MMNTTTLLSTNNNAEQTTKNTLKVAELFAGVGGFRVGLEAANKNNTNTCFDIAWSNQFEPSTKRQHASEVYTARFGNEGHINEDIAKVETSSIPRVDVLVGGFPCQDYSIACTLANSNGIDGKKGILWWQIERILAEKGDNAPKHLILENVDRLLQSGSNKGRDFAIILSSLNSLGYAVEWRVVTASEYGMSQRRKRVFIYGSKAGTVQYDKILTGTSHDIIAEDGLIARSFPVEKIDADLIKSGAISSDLVEVSANFNIETPKKSPFQNAGYMINGEFHTIRTKADYSGTYVTLGDVLQDESEVAEEFYIDSEDVHKWEYKKGAKSFDRINKTTGAAYKYSEGGMAFPDKLDRASRTIITGEGGRAASRVKHAVEVNGRLRRLTPVELERLNGFEDDHTKLEGVSDTKRAFLMGNALVAGVIEELGDTLLRDTETEQKESADFFKLEQAS